MREHAMAYAAAGIPVIPLWGITADGVCSCAKGSDCTSAGKHPRYTQWQAATANPGAIGNYFGRYEASGVPANIGLRLIDCGLAVIDVDSADGADALEDLVSAEELDAMPCANSGRGVHYYVKTDRRPGTIAPGLELKSENVVAPPSLAAGGRVRSWVAGRTLRSVADAPALPESITRLLGARTPIRSGGSHRSSAAPSVLVGPSSDFVRRVLLDRGMAEQLVNKYFPVVA